MKMNPVATLWMMCFCIWSCTESQTNAQSQSTSSKTKVGGGCEGCEAIHESTIPFEKLSSTCTLPDYNEPGIKLVVNGVVFKADGKTPAPNVVLYIYHTDQTGHYSKKGDEKGWGKRHGYIRGWMRTNEKGEYKFFTLKPAPYPGGKNPSHIHITIKEPELNEYWIDEFVFDDDPVLTADERQKMENRGGNGILHTTNAGNILKAERNIYLGKNIPDYPKQKSTAFRSGIDIGEDCPAFDPLHISGPDKGKNACPMCKYGKGQGIMIWWNEKDLHVLETTLQEMERAIDHSGYNKLRVFVIYMNPTGKSASEARILLEDFTRLQNLQKVAVTFIPSAVDPGTAGVYRINPEAGNTIFVYRKRRVVDKFINYDFRSGTHQLVSKLDPELSKAL